MDAVIVLLILLFVLLAIGVPVGFAIGGATMISMFFFSDLNMVVNAQYCYSGIFSFTVMAIPYFMLAGTIMSTGGNPVGSADGISGRNGRPALVKGMDHRGL